MSHDALRDLDVATGRKEACGGLEEKEGLLWDGVVKLLGVFAVIAANGNNLFEVRKLA